MAARSEAGDLYMCSCSLVLCCSCSGASNEGETEGERASPVSDESMAGGKALPSGDQLHEHVRAMCLLEEDERVMLAGKVAQSLSKSVEAWQEVWLSVDTHPSDKQAFDHRVFQQLLLTALLCSAHLQVS